MKVFSNLANMLLVMISVFFSLFCLEAYLVLASRSNVDLKEVYMVLNGNRYHFIEDKEAFQNIKKAIVFIGDSFTVGLKCGNKNNFPGQFRKLLNDNSIDLSTINLGVGDTGIFSYLERVNDFISTFESPAAIIVTLYMNDIKFDPISCKYIDLMVKDSLLNDKDYVKLSSYCKQEEEIRYNSGNQRIRIFHRWITKNFHSYRFLRDEMLKMLIALGYDIKWGRRNYAQKWEQHNGLNFKLIMFAIKKMKQISDNYKVPLIIVIYPDVGFISNENPFVGIYKSVSEKLATELFVPVYSGYEAFLSQHDQRDIPSSMIWSVTDHHPNCEAHHVFASWIFNKLISNGTFSNCL